MYGQKHPLTYRSGSAEKFVKNLTFKQTAWLALGGYLSLRLATYIPPLPLESLIFRHIHHLIPLGICAIFGFVREGKTGLPMYSYLYNWIAFHHRPRKLIYRKGAGR